MKRIEILEPLMLCEPVKNQEMVNGIYIAKQENISNPIRRVYLVSKAAESRGIKNGDYVLLRSPKNQSVPACLTENNEVPYKLEDVECYEIVDPASVVAIYREQE